MSDATRTTNTAKEASITTTLNAECLCRDLFNQGHGQECGLIEVAREQAAQAAVKEGRQTMPNLTKRQREIMATLTAGRSYMLPYRAVLGMLVEVVDGSALPTAKLSAKTMAAIRPLLTQVEVTDTDNPAGLPLPIHLEGRDTLTVLVAPTSTQPANVQHSGPLVRRVRLHIPK